MKPIMTCMMTAAVVAVVAGCGKSGTETMTENSGAADAVPARIQAVLGTPVSGVENMSIAQRKPELKAGDTVTLEGKVMGSKHPFVDGRAVVVIGDETTLESCDLMESDACKTPWDVCCDSSEDILAGTVLIQVLDAEGQLLKHGLKGVKGLTELSRVRVKGTVAPFESGETVSINAEAIELL